MALPRMSTNEVLVSLNALIHLDPYESESKFFSVQKARVGEHISRSGGPNTGFTIPSYSIISQTLHVCIYIYIKKHKNTIVGITME